MSKHQTLVGVALGVLLLASCSGEPRSDKGTSEKGATAEPSNDSGNANQKESGQTEKNSDGANVIILKNSGEFEFQGDKVKSVKELPTFVSNKLFQGKGTNDLSIPLALDAEEKPTFAVLEKTVRSLQMFGFRNLRLKTKEGYVSMPPLAMANEVNSIPSHFAIRVNAHDGGFGGLKVECDGVESWLESTDRQDALEFIEKLFNDFVSKVDAQKSGTNKMMDVEVIALPNLPAKTYLDFCQVVHSVVRSKPNETKIKFRFWPLGMPREEAVELNLPNEIQFEDHEVEGVIRDSQPDEEFGEFKLDDVKGQDEKGN